MLIYWYATYHQCHQLAHWALTAPLLLLELVVDTDWLLLLHGTTAVQMPWGYPLVLYLTSPLSLAGPGQLCNLDCLANTRGLKVPLEQR